MFGLSQQKRKNCGRITRLSSANNSYFEKEKVAQKINRFKTNTNIVCLCYLKSMFGTTSLILLGHKNVPRVRIGGIGKEEHEMEMS